MFKQQMILNSYDRKEALELVQEFYVPAVVKEYNLKDRKKIREHNVKDCFRNVDNSSSGVSKHLFVPPLKSLGVDTKREIAERLLDWIEDECYRIMYKDEGVSK